MLSCMLPLAGTEPLTEASCSLFYPAVEAALFATCQAWPVPLQPIGFCTAVFLLWFLPVFPISAYRGSFDVAQGLLTAICDPQIV